MSKAEKNRTIITRKVCTRLLAEIRNGDLDHGLSVAEMLLSEGPAFDPELLVDIVEAVLELSKQAGSLDAENFLREKWPVLKKAQLRRLRAKAAEDN